MARTGLCNPIAFCAALAAAGFGCGGTSANTPPANNPGAATAGTTTDGGASATTASASRVRFVPKVDSPWIAGRNDDGSEWWVMGAMRLRASPDGFEFADDVTAGIIVAATPMEHGWVFVANDGAVARADSFLGTLHRLGNIPRALTDGQSGSGRLAIVDDGGTLWTTDGTADVAPMSSLPEGRCLSAIFKDARHGIAVMDGGNALRTDDGGRRWHALGLGGDAAGRARAVGDTLVLVTTAGPRPVADDGSVGPAADRRLGREREAIDAESAMPAFDAMERKFPVFFQLRNSRSVARADGTVLVVSSRDGDRDLRVLDGTSGAVLQTLSNALPEECPRERSLVPWGPGAALTCRNLDTGSVTLYRVSRDAHVARVGEVGSPEADIVYSDDGRHAAHEGACDPDAEPAEHAFCVLGDDDRWRTVRLDRGVSRLGGMHGTDVLLQAAPPSDDAPTQMVLHTDTGTLVPIRISRRDGMPRLTLASAAFTSDGKLFGVGQQENATPSLLIGDPAQPLTAVALPAGAWGVGFSDSQHGIAAGFNVSKLWRTSDGGRSWVAVNAHVDGSSEAVSLRNRFVPDMVGVNCDARGCTAGNLVRIDGWGDPAPAAPAVLAATERATPESPRRTLDDAGITFNRMRCEPQGHERNAPTLRPGPAPARAHPQHRWLATTGAVARLDAWNDTQHVAWTYQLSWRGEDARGAYTSASRAAALAVRTPSLDGNDGDDRPGYVLRGATRQLALVERCDEIDSDGARCELIAVPNEGEPRIVDHRDEIERALDRRGYIANTIASDDGGFLVLLALYGGEFAVHDVMLIGPDGQLRGHRAFAWDAEYATPVYAVGRYRNQLGYAAVSPAEPQVFRFWALGASLDAQPIELPRLRPGNVPSCSAPRASDGAEIITTITAFLPSIDLPESSWAEDIRARLELSPEGECLRAVESWVPSGVLSQADRLGGFGVRVIAGSDGTLVGVRDDGAHRQPLHCH